MTLASVMFIAGEASGDGLAAELLAALRRATSLQAIPPRFFGAGGPRLAQAGAELAFDLTQHSVIGLWEALRGYFTFRDLMDQLLDLACQQQPDVIICVDFSGFNRRFARALRKRLRNQTGPFQNWRPRLVQYVSPQVWASRPGRARGMAEDYDLLLSIFPFEPAWYAQRVPRLAVRFVGHPLVDRYRQNQPPPPDSPEWAQRRQVLFLPGSRVGEIRRHVPILAEAWNLLAQARPELRATLVLPDDSLRTLAQSLWPAANVTWQIGELASALQSSILAIACTGTVTLECAYFGVPTVALYRTSWSTYQIGRRLIQVKYLAMPNLLADAPLFPEFVQDAASPENLAGAALTLLNDPAQARATREKLAQLVAGLGVPGANERAAAAILTLFPESR